MIFFGVPTFWLGPFVSALIAVLRILRAANLIDSVIDWREDA